MSSAVSVLPYGEGDPPLRTKRGCRLQSERKWVVEGPHEHLREIAAELPEATRTWAGAGALVLNLINSVGILDLPHLGAVELFTGKFGGDDFDAMLRDLTEAATTLPFSAGKAAAGRYAVGTAPRDEALYHAFVYLRHILSDGAPEEARLLPALELILREPHRRWRSDRRDVRIEAMTRVDSHTPFDLVTRPGTAVVPSSLAPSAAWLADRLGGRLPEVVSERRIRPTTDTPENRFVKAFIGQSRAIIGRMRSALASRRRDAFRRRLLRDCDWMEASLMPIARHRMWEEVGRMARIPFASTVLQRRMGYRRVLHHFARIRLAPMIPLDKDDMRDLLELNNIALLYELWTFFLMASEIEAVVGSPPVRSGGLHSDAWGTQLAAGGLFDWASGVRLVYNQSFARSETGDTHSYSVGLRPDIALWVPDGPSAGLHLFDAKFRIQAQDTSFNRNDIHKMHAYRDAIPAARSVWILYPGQEFRFFAEPGGGGREQGRVAAAPEGLPADVAGVGAIPLGPVGGTAGGDGRKEYSGAGWLGETLARLLALESASGRGPDGRGTAAASA